MASDEPARRGHIRSMGIFNPQTGWHDHIEIWVSDQPISKESAEAFLSAMHGETWEEWKARRGGEEHLG